MPHAYWYTEGPPIDGEPAACDSCRFRQLGIQRHLCRKYGEMLPIMLPYLRCSGYHGPHPEAHRPPPQKHKRR